MLLRCGVDVNSRDTDGWTPLHAAAHWGQEEVCSLLADNMCDMGAVNNVVSVRKRSQRRPGATGRTCVVTRRCAADVLAGPNAFGRGRREPGRRAGGASEETERRESPLAFAPPTPRLTALLQRPLLCRLLTACVYISPQLRSEREKQTPVIDTSQQIPIVQVRARRSVPAGCGHLCVCVWGSGWAQLTPSIPSASGLHASFPVSHFSNDTRSPASDSGLKSGFFRYFTAVVVDSYLSPAS